MLILQKQEIFIWFRETQGHVKTMLQLSLEKKKSQALKKPGDKTEEPKFTLPAKDLAMNSDHPCSPVIFFTLTHTFFPH